MARGTKSVSPSNKFACGCGLLRQLFLGLLIVGVAVWGLLAFPTHKRNSSVSRSFPNAITEPHDKSFPNALLQPSPSASPDRSINRRTSIAMHRNASFLKRKKSSQNGPYHNWDFFRTDFQEMLTKLKIFVYPDVYNTSSPFAGIFVPQKNPYHPKLGNYFSEHMFKINLLNSSFLTANAKEAHFFFLPFSVNSLRNDPRVHSEASIAEFVARYSKEISERFGYWNLSRGADHFYVCCHSVGRDAASKFLDLQRNAIQVVCSSSYYHKFYISHKDIALPQVWPRIPEKILVPQHERTRLVFFAGRGQNSRIRQKLIRIWKNDTSMDIHSGNLPYSYEEGFRKSKYCLHVKGYEVNTARLSDAIHFGCVPVIISDHYDLPFANVLDWSKFSIVISHKDVPFLKAILLSISKKMYASFHANLYKVREHFQWHASAKGYDSFHMTAYELWLRRAVHFSRVS